MGRSLQRRSLPWLRLLDASVLVDCRQRSTDEERAAPCVSTVFCVFQQGPKYAPSTRRSALQLPFATQTREKLAWRTRVFPSVVLLVSKVIAKVDVVFST